MKILLILLSTLVLSSCFFYEEKVATVVNKSYSRPIKGNISLKKEFKESKGLEDYEEPFEEEGITNIRYKGHYKVGRPYKVKNKVYRPREDSNYRQVGMASWYGDDFHGKRTANGDIYNTNHMTAAHTTLPLPCIVLVKNLTNGRSVKLMVNDRGPFAKNRIIDVSEAAAKFLGFRNKGTEKVKVVFMKKDTEILLKRLGLKS